MTKLYRRLQNIFILVTSVAFTFGFYLTLSRGSIIYAGPDRCINFCCNATDADGNCIERKDARYQPPSQACCGAPPCACQDVISDRPGCQAEGCCTDECCCDSGGPPPPPPPPSCSNFQIRGVPFDNENLTTSRDVFLNWGMGGTTPATMELTSFWGHTNPNGPWEKKLETSGGYSPPPKPFRLTNEGWHVGWYKVTAKFSNSHGSATCEDTILYDRPPVIVNVQPTLTGHWGDWSGTERDSDNNKNYKDGKDNNPMSFRIVARDPDGIWDIKFVNFGIGGKVGSFEASDSWEDQSCTNDPLEKILSQSGFGVTFNFSNGNYTGFSNICGGSGGDRYSVNNVRASKAGDAITIDFDVVFKGNIDDGIVIDEGMQYAWAKAGDWQGAFSGPSGRDLYSNVGTWGIDLTPPTTDNRDHNGFGQKQPLTAKSVRIWWDAADTYSGVRSIEKGCSYNGQDIESNRPEGPKFDGSNSTNKSCYGLRVYSDSGPNSLNPTFTGWDDIILNPVDGISTYSTDLSDPNAPNFSDGYKNYLNKDVGYEEEIYLNNKLKEGDDYRFHQWLTDGANNMIDMDDDGRRVGGKWMQVISGDIFGNIQSFGSIPDDSFDGNGYAELIDGLSSVMFKKRGATLSSIEGKSNAEGYMTTDQYVLGGTEDEYEFEYGPSYIFDGNGAEGSIFDNLKQRAIDEGHSFTLCSRVIDIYHHRGCDEDIRNVMRNGGVFREQGVYLLNLTADVSIDGPSLSTFGHAWVNRSMRGKNAIVLIEGNGHLFSITPTLDPPFNMIILARDADINLRTTGNNKLSAGEHGFEKDFLEKAGSGNFCGHENPILGQGQPCGEVNGKASPEEWNDENYRDKDTYIISGYDYEDEDYGTKNTVVDPGVDMFGVYIISNSDVTIVNEEDDYATPDGEGQLAKCIREATENGEICADWDGDFERMEMKGGIVTSGQIRFKRDLIVLDNYWIPAEKFMYSPVFLNAYIELTKGKNPTIDITTNWEEIGFDY